MVNCCYCCLFVCLKIFKCICIPFHITNTGGHTYKYKYFFLHIIYHTVTSVYMCARELQVCLCFFLCEYQCLWHVYSWLTYLSGAVYYSLLELNFFLVSVCIGKNNNNNNNNNTMYITITTIETKITFIDAISQIAELQNIL